jgi:hypothetical protein
VNVQVIDGAGRVRFRTSTGEPVCGDLLGALEVRIDGEATPADVHVPPDELPALLDRLRSQLRRRVDGVQQQQLPAPTPFATRVEVLGTSLLLYERDPEHAALLRLADLLRRLEEASTEDAELDVYLVPDLSVARYLMLSGIRQRTEAVSETQLRSAARDELRRLTTRPGAPDDPGYAYREAAGQLEDDAELARAIEMFVQSGLLERTDQGGPLLPTRKLRSIVI